MRLSRLIFSALSVSNAAFSASVGESIVGNFELKLGKPGNNVIIRLECESETSCTLTTISQSDVNPYEDIQSLTNVSAVKNLTYATNALKYAIDQRSRPIQNEEFAESMRLLSPILSADPKIDKCWDLNYPSAEYMLACTFNISPPRGAPLYLFGTLLANCGEAFCRYVINPMSRVK
jgi:hypothetical protein